MHRPEPGKIIHNYLCLLDVFVLGLVQIKLWTCHAWGNARAMEQLMSLFLGGISTEWMGRAFSWALPPRGWNCQRGCQSERPHLGEGLLQICFLNAFTLECLYTMLHVRKYRLLQKKHKIKKNPLIVFILPRVTFVPEVVSPKNVVTWEILWCMPYSFWCLFFFLSSKKLIFNDRIPHSLPSFAPLEGHVMIVLRMAIIAKPKTLKPLLYNP